MFEECRNLFLGLASRGVDWRQQGFRGTVGITIGIGAKLFNNLLARCDSIAVAMAARGFEGPDTHALRDGGPPPPPGLRLPSAADVGLLLCLAGLAWLSCTVVL